MISQIRHFQPERTIHSLFLCEKHMNKALCCATHRMQRHCVLTWASKVRPEWQRFSALHRIKPGRISSSSMPFSRNLRFSPGPASSVSTSSDNRLSTSTTCCIRQDKSDRARRDGEGEMETTGESESLPTGKLHQAIRHIYNLCLTTVEQTSHVEIAHRLKIHLRRLTVNEGGCTKKLTFENYFNWSKKYRKWNVWDTGVAQRQILTNHHRELVRGISSCWWEDSEGMGRKYYHVWVGHNNLSLRDPWQDCFSDQKEGFLSSLLPRRFTQFSFCSTYPLY